MEIKAPDLGVDSAEVSEIMVKVGDVVNSDDNIALVESDKASVEIPAGVSGTVTAILIQVGDQISQGSPLITISESAAAEKSEEQAPANVEVATKLETNEVVSASEKSPLIVPGAADLDSVAPAIFLTKLTASTPSSTIAITGFFCIASRLRLKAFSPRRVIIVPIVS